jgi:regulator of cell morphogenesis and NO signaling
MHTIDANTTLGELVNEKPACVSLLERLRLDYCCGGAQTLAEACARRGIDPHTVRVVLEALAEAPAGPSDLEELDWRGVSLGELCDHIVERHHDGLRRELPRIEELLRTVVRVHGRGNLGLYDLQRTFVGMTEELLPHLELEERVLFPAARKLEVDGAAVAEPLLHEHERDHEHVGDSLTALRELTSDYRVDRALCGTHRALLDALRSLEQDLHQHLHEENNVLFPRVRALNATASTRLTTKKAVIGDQPRRHSPSNS